MLPEGAHYCCQSCGSLYCVRVGVARASRPVDAQQSEEDFGIWLGGFANGRLPPSLNNVQGSWRLWMDVQARFGDDASRFARSPASRHRLYARSRLDGLGRLCLHPNGPAIFQVNHDRTTDLGAGALERRHRRGGAVVTDPPGAAVRQHRKRDRLAIAGIRQTEAAGSFAGDLVSGGDRRGTS